MSHDRVSPSTQPECRTHDEIRGSARETIHSAVGLLKAKHQVQESSAYTILVQASVDGRVSVREAAQRILENVGKPTRLEQDDEQDVVQAGSAS